jgi:hypothetical protein
MLCNHLGQMKQIYFQNSIRDILSKKNVASVKYSIIWKKEVDINNYIAFYVKSVSESIWKKPLLLGTKETNTLQIQAREGQTSLKISHYVNFFVIRTLVVPCYLCGLVTGLKMGIKICGCLAGCCGSHLFFLLLLFICAYNAWVILWLTLVILAIWEVEIDRITVWG